MRGIIRTCALAVVVAVCASLYAAENLVSIESSLAAKIAASSKALPEAKERLLRFSRAGQFQCFGVPSAEEAGSLELEGPLPVYWVPYGDLRQFTPARDPAELMVDAREVLYLAVNRNLRRVASAVIVRETAGGWKPVMFGFAHSAAKIDRAQRLASRRSAKAARFLVRIRALNISFLAYGSGGEVMLIALANNSFLHIEENETRPAREFFTLMAARSRELNLEGAS